VTLIFHIVKLINNIIILKLSKHESKEMNSWWQLRTFSKSMTLSMESTLKSELRTLGWIFLSKQEVFMLALNRPPMAPIFSPRFHDSVRVFLSSFPHITGRFRSKWTKQFMAWNNKTLYVMSFDQWELRIVFSSQGFTPCGLFWLLIDLGEFWQIQTALSSSGPRSPDSIPLIFPDAQSFLF
jgi:hypothetical protein